MQARSKRGGPLTATRKRQAGRGRALAPEVQPKRLARKDVVLIVVGLGVWIGIGAGGVWLARTLMAPQEQCSSNADARQQPDRGPIGMRQSLKVLGAKTRCD